MLRDGAAIGAIIVIRPENAIVLRQADRLLQTFADQAVIAIENTRLFNELQARTAELGRSVEELQALGEVGQAVSSTLDLDTVLDTIISRANQLAGDRRRRRSTNTTKRLKSCALRATQSFEERSLMPCARSRFGREKAWGPRGRDARSLPSSRHHGEGAYRGRTADSLIQRRVPGLAGRAADTGGASHRGLLVGRKQPGEFPREVVDLLTTFASQSALAMQNARLFRSSSRRAASWRSRASTSPSSSPT